jgi:hypothetical protein
MNSCIKYFYNKKSKIDIEPTHYQILKKLKNNHTLNKEDFTFVKTLSNDQLFEIIQINNLVVKRLTSYLEHSI